MSSLDHVRWLSKPSLKQPVIVTAFTGWNDAADAASNAVRNLIEGWRAQPLAEIDPEEFTDFATIRPHVRLKDGGVRNIVWPTVGLWHVSGAGGDIILVLGPEPSLKWRTFSEQLMGVADHFGSSMMLTLGALLADVPHSRPVQIIGTATDDDLIDRFELQRSRYEGPTGIVGVLHDSCYTAAMPSAAPPPVLRNSPLTASGLSARGLLFSAAVITSMIADVSPCGRMDRRIPSSRQSIPQLSARAATGATQSASPSWSSSVRPCRSESPAAPRRRYPRGVRA